MSRYTTTGNDRPHIVHHGYADRSRFDVPLTRDDDKPSYVILWIVGSLIAALIIGLSWAGVS